MASTTKKAQVFLTLNATQATQSIKDLQRLALLLADDIDEATKRWEAFTKAGKKANAALEMKNINAMKQRMQAYTTAVEKSIEQTKSLADIIADLSDTKLRDLKRAMGQAKNQLSSLTGSDADLQRAEQIRKEMKQIGDQIRLIEGEYVKMTEIVGNLNNVSDQTLSKAIKQQKDLVASLDKTDAAYLHEVDILKQLTAQEEKRRLAAKPTEKGMNGHQARQILSNVGGSSVNDVNEAIRVMGQLQNRVAAGSPVWKAYEERIRAAKEELAKLQGKAKEVKELEKPMNGHQARQILGNIGGNSVEQVNEAIKVMGQLQQKVAAGSPVWQAYEQRINAAKEELSKLQGEVFNVSKGIGELSVQSDKWLSKAIRTQSDLVASLKKTDASYAHELQILRQLEAEEERRKQKMNYGQASNIANNANKSWSVNQIKEAQKVISKHRDDTADNYTRQTDNKMLSELQKQLDIIEGKEQKVAIGWQKMKQVMQNPFRSSAEDIKATMDAIQQKIAKLPAGSQRVVELRRKYEELEKVLKGAKMSQQQLNDILLRSKTGKANIDELKRAYKQLEDEINKINTGDPAFKNKQKDLKQLKKLIDEVTGAANKQSGAWSTAMRNLTAYVGLFAAFNKAKQLFTDFFRLNQEFSDQLVNIRKVSGLAMSDIERMANNLAKIDTRTSIQELNQIAYAGAKLGIGEYGVDSLESFVRAANQVNVALKEDLGEEALTALSKITEVMGLIPKLGVEEAMLRTGSAIFKLQSTSTATSGKIIEFSNRMLSLGKQAALSTADILALGAAVDSMALEPEVAATAFGKLVNSIRKGTNTIEKDLGLVQGSLKDMLERGEGMKAILTIFRTMGEQENLFALDGLFKDLGSDGERLIKTMVTMSDKNGMLSKAVETANQAFDDGTAVTLEYNMQQETAAAYMQRTSNAWEKFFVNSQNANGPVKEIAESLYDLTQSMIGAGEATGGFKFALDAMVLAIKAIIDLIPLIVSGLLTKGIGAAFMQLGPIIASTWSLFTAGVKAVIPALRTAAEATGGLKAQWTALKSAMSVNVLATVVGVATQLYFWMSQHEEKLNAVQRAQKAVNDLHKEAAAQAQAQILNVESLAAVARDETAALEDRITAVEALNKLVPEYNGYLDETTGKYTENAKALKNYTDELIRSYEVEGAKAKLAEMGARKAQAKIDKFEAQKTVSYQLEQLKQGNDDEVDPIEIYKAVKKAREAQEEYDAVVEEEKIIRELYDEDIKKNALDSVRPKGVPVGDGDTTKKKGSGAGKTDNKEAKIAKERANALLANIQAYYEEQRRKFYDWVYQMNKDGEKVSDEYASKALQTLLEHEKTATGLARQSIATAGKEWDEFQSQLVYDQFGEATETDKRLLSDIEKSNIQDLHNLFERLGANLAKENNKTLSENLGALLDEIFKNGSRDLRKAAEELVKRQREMYAILNRDEYVRNAGETTRNNMDAWDLLITRADMNNASQAEVAAVTKRFNDILSKSREQIVKLYDMDMIEDEKAFEDSMKSFLSEFNDVFYVTGYSYKELRMMLKFLIDDEVRYEEALKKRQDRQSKRNDLDWEHSDEYKQYRKDETTLDTTLSAQRIFGVPKSNIKGEDSSDLQTSWRATGENMGFEFKIDNDPELLLYELRMQKAEEYFRRKSDLLAQGKASEEEYNEALQKYMSAMTEYSSRVQSDMAAQIDSLMSFLSPLRDFGAEVGEAFGTMIDDSKAGKKAILQATKSMIKSFAQQTLQMIQKNEQEQVSTAMHNTRMQAMQTAFDNAMLTQQIESGNLLLQIKAQQDNQEVDEEALKLKKKIALQSAGIFGMCVSALGPIGGPIAYSAMMAVLMGLLNFALSFIGKGDSKAADAKGPNTKLVTGMLTYDSGNVSDLKPFFDKDGNMYWAEDNGDKQHQGISLLTHPTATNINGEPSLVAERGPELVIGRETTQAMMQNNPALLRALYQYDKHHSGRNAYDQGNLFQMPMETTPSHLGEGQGRGATDAALANAIAMLVARLNEPINASINMYGRDGLYEQHRRASAFMKGK